MTERRIPARIQEVAALARVSVATVSNVVNRPERVARDTADTGYEHGYAVVLCDSADDPDRETG